MSIPNLPSPALFAAEENGRSVSTRLVYQFPDPTWIENTAVRSNGELLLTILRPYGALYLLAEPFDSQPRILLIHNFTSVSGLVGITEVKHDLFVATGGNFTTSGLSTSGSSCVWTVDFRANKPIVKFVTRMPEAGLLNGVERIDKHETGDEVLIADSTRGLVLRLDIASGDSSVVFQGVEMTAPPNATFPIGINGIHLFDGYLYWSNSYDVSMYRTRVDSGVSTTRNGDREACNTRSNIPEYVDFRHISP